MSKRIFPAVALLVFVLSFAGAALAQDAETPMQTQDQIDSMLYGEVGVGGVIQRLGKVETDLFGRELPGSISERQLGLVNFMRDGTLGQPSMIFKTGVAEWAVIQEIRVDLPLSRRIAEIERQLEGSAGEERPLAMRLERLLALLFPGQLFWEDIRVPANTVLKASFVDGVSPKNAKEGDIVKLRLEDHLSVEGYLVAPRGSRINARVDKVRPPRSFGRPSEISFVFDNLEPLGPEKIPMFLGDAAATAADPSKTGAAAAGTSIVGLILLGPVGLAGGYLIRGDALEIPSGTAIYLETAAAVNVKGFPIPPALQGLLEKKQDKAGDTQLEESAETPGEGGVNAD